MKKIKWIFGILALVTVGACVWYVNDYYHADQRQIENYAVDNIVEVENWERELICVPEEAKCGFIFYPGGKVECTAYLPLMKECASRGILCILAEMPFNLAVLDIDAAEGLQERYPEIEEWYIGGHSLGGTMAAAYLGDHEDEFEGLILLGSYTTEDLREKEIRALSLYGSEDHVLNMENYQENKVNLPETFEEEVIEGGCHAYFGMYGVQDGDGTPTISNEEQIEFTAERINAFVSE